MVGVWIWRGVEGGGEVECGGGLGGDVLFGGEGVGEGVEDWWEGGGGVCYVGGEGCGGGSGDGLDGGVGVLEMVDYGGDEFWEVVGEGGFMGGWKGGEYLEGGGVGGGVVGGGGGGERIDEERESVGRKCWYYRF